MKIGCIRWTTDRMDHIARHQVGPDEVEEAAFDDPNRFIRRLKAANRDPDQKLYLLLGRTAAGRYLTLIFIYEGRGVAYPVTARDMKPGERRLYHGSRQG
ncbi:MAG: hypothetical protein QMC81_11645 [Thermoanaerobacterales bacterium]|nr:BrnT family toxin [Bacillota bacterium]MDI6908123.1 hypothetical protein [Thermoanaerobacterales bacterium]